MTADGFEIRRSRLTHEPDSETLFTLGALVSSTMGERKTDIEDMQEMLEQLEANGYLDSERVTFDTMTLGGIHLDKIGDELSEVDYGRDPVKITIEPESTHPEDHHYSIHFESLEYVDGDDGHELVSDRVADRTRFLADNVRAMDALVPSEVDGVDSVVVNENIGRVMFEIEADVFEIDGPGRAHTEYMLPEQLQEAIDYHDAEIEDIRLLPDGKGWGSPVYAMTLEVSSVNRQT